MNTIVKKSLSAIVSILCLGALGSVAHAQSNTLDLAIDGSTLPVQHLSVDSSNHTAVGNLPEIGLLGGQANDYNHLWNIACDHSEVTFGPHAVTPGLNLDTVSFSNIPSEHVNCHASPKGPKQPGWVMSDTEGGYAHWKQADGSGTVPFKLVVWPSSYVWGNGNQYFGTHDTQGLFTNVVDFRMCGRDSVDAGVQQHPMTTVIDAEVTGTLSHIPEDTITSCHLQPISTALQFSKQKNIAVVLNSPYASWEGFTGGATTTNDFGGGVTTSTISYNSHSLDGTSSEQMLGGMGVSVYTQPTLDLTEFTRHLKLRPGYQLKGWRVIRYAMQNSNQIDANNDHLSGIETFPEYGRTIQLLFDDPHGHLHVGEPYHLVKDLPTLLHSQSNFDYDTVHTKSFTFTNAFTFNSIPDDRAPNGDWRDWTDTAPRRTTPDATTPFSDTTAINDVDMVTAVVLAPVIEQAPMPAIIYDANGGMFTKPNKVSRMVEKETTIRGNRDVEDEGNYLVGWNTKPNGTGESYHMGDPAPEKLEKATLYAQWKNQEIHTDLYQCAANQGAEQRNFIGSDPQQSILSHIVSLRAAGVSMNDKDASQYQTAYYPFVKVPSEQYTGVIRVKLCATPGYRRIHYQAGPGSMWRTQDVPMQGMGPGVELPSSRQFDYTDNQRARHQYTGAWRICPNTSVSSFMQSDRYGVKDPNVFQAGERYMVPPINSIEALFTPADVYLCGIELPTVATLPQTGVNDTGVQTAAVIALVSLAGVSLWRVGASIRVE